MMALFHVSAPCSGYRLRSFFGGKKHTPSIFMIKEPAHVDNDVKQGKTVQVHEMVWGSLANHIYRSQEKRTGLTESVSIKLSRTALFQGPTSRKCANNMVSDCC